MKMYRMLIFFTICLLLLLDNVENFKLTKNQMMSHLRKQSSSTSIARQSHTCLTSCFFTLSFNDSLILPNDCYEITTNNSCDMSIIIDYPTQEILFYSYQVSGSLTHDSITYDSSTSHLAYLTVDEDPILHFFDYICAVGNGCEWEYMQQIIPKLIHLNYQPLYDLLLPKVFNSDGHPSLTQCYNNTVLVNCSSGSCRYYHSVDNNYQLEINRECSLFEISSVEIGLVQYFPGPSKHDYSTLDFICDKDRCNDQSNVDEIMQIISLNANEYIYAHSLGIKLQWTSLIFYFLSFILIKKF